MMRVDVLNVADGACSVLSPCGGRGLMMIDCGTSSRSRDRVDRTKAPPLPAVVAATHLGQRVADIDTLLVTHFDSDHWHGLLGLTQHYQVARGGTPGRVRLFYPGMPDVVAPGGEEVRGQDFGPALLSFLTLRDGFAVDAATLIERWGQVANVVASPLFAGDTFCAAGNVWKVLWPPAKLTLTNGWVGRVRKFVDGMNELADEMQHRGDPYLRETLDTVYERLNVRGEDDGAANNGEGNPQFVDSLNSQTEGDEFERGTVGGEVFHDEIGRETQAGRFPDDVAELRGIPGELAAKVSELRELGRGLDNLLSVVAGTEDQRFVTFGDIEKSALTALLKHNKFESYGIMLAPHHGSHARSGLPGAQVCIGQNGSYLEQHFGDHSSEHRVPHLSTWENGNITFCCRGGWCFGARCWC